MDNTALPVPASLQSLSVVGHDFFDDILWDDEHVHDSPLSLTRTSINGGTGALETTAPTDNSYSGLYTLGTGTTNNATGKSVLDSSGGTNRIKAGGGSQTIEWRIRISNLSGTPEFNIKLGLQDSSAIGDASNCICIGYSSTINSGNWRGTTRNASTSTFVNSSIAVAANTWYKLQIRINAAGTNVEFFIDGVSIGSSTTNIPTGNAMRLMASIEKQGTSSATSRSMDIDYVYYRVER
jgi:hypothetical protein